MKSLRLLAFLVLGVALAYASDFSRATREKCKAELGLSDADLLVGEHDPRKLGCYLFCFLKEQGAMGEDGHFDQAAYKKSIKEDSTDPFKSIKPFIFVNVGYCQYTHFPEVEPRAEKACEKAGKMIACLYQFSGRKYLEQVGYFQPPPPFELE